MFTSFNANAVREARRAQEAQILEEESRRWRQVAQNSAWSATAAEAAAREKMVQEKAATANVEMAAAAAVAVAR